MKGIKMTNYFEKINSLDELKKTYKNLVKKFHPDIYGEKGNMILKEIHNQLEKAIQKLDKDYFKAVDEEEDEKTTAKKKKFAKEAIISKDPEFSLFASYFLNGFKPQKHRNPMTSKMFHGRNVWTLELKYLINNYKSCEWSTPLQYKNANNCINKGEKCTPLTLAVYAKEKDENGKEIEKFKCYKGYFVANYEQTKNYITSKENSKINDKQKMEQIVDKTTDAKESEIVEQRPLDLWEKYDVVA